MGLSEGQAEIVVDTHHLTGGFHLRPQDGIDPRKPAEGKNRFFDGYIFGDYLPGQPQRLKGFTHNHPGRHIGQGHTGGLAHKRNGSGSPWIHLDHIDNTISDRVLDVHETHHRQLFGQRPGMFHDGLKNFRFQGNGGEHAGAVATVNTRFLDMFHDATDDGIVTIGNGIHINFNGPVQKPVHQNRLSGRHLDRSLHVIFQILAVIDDFHGPSPQHK